MGLLMCAAQSETAGTVVKFITENGSAVNPGQVRSRFLACLLCGGLWMQSASRWSLAVLRRTDGEASHLQASKLLPSLMSVSPRRPPATHGPVLCKEWHEWILCENPLNGSCAHVHVQHEGFSVFCFTFVDMLSVCLCGALQPLVLIRP